ncbi:MAG: group III truncated hemoglobin [Pseudomonadales bacterium]
MGKPDLNSKQHIQQFVEAFYGKMLKDEQLAPIFLDVAEVDLSAHLPLISSYWEKLLLGDKEYNRHTMNIHRAIHAKNPLTQQDFERWLALFTSTVDTLFEGDKTERAKRIANQIAINMQIAISIPVSV